DSLGHILYLFRDWMGAKLLVKPNSGLRIRAKLVVDRQSNAECHGARFVQLASDIGYDEMSIHAHEAGPNIEGGAADRAQLPLSTRLAQKLFEWREGFVVHGITPHAAAFSRWSRSAQRMNRSPTNVLNQRSFRSVVRPSSDPSSFVFPSIVLH